MNREQIVALAAEAADIVTRGRNEEYGQPEDSFEAIASVWQGYIEALASAGSAWPPKLGASNVADMLLLMKMCRNLHQPKRDSFVDMIGYALCGARIAGIGAEGEA